MEFSLSINGKDVPLTGSSCTINGASFGSGGTSTSTCVITQQYSKELQDVEIKNTEEGNFIEITYRKIPTGWYISTVNNKQKMLKEVYGVLGGKLQLIKSIEGIEEPGYYVPPSIEWEE